MAADLTRLPIVRRLLTSADPTVVVKARRDLFGEPEHTLMELRRSLADTNRARRLLAHRRPDGTIATNPYTSGRDCRVPIEAPFVVAQKRRPAF